MANSLPTPVKTQVRALFLDIDGTLVSSHDHISGPVREALSEARQKGCEIVLCTGRTRFTAQTVMEQIEPPHGYIIASNGGVVMHLDSGEILLRRLLSIPVALEIVRAIVDCGAEPYVYEDAVGEGVEAARVLHHPDLPVGPWATRPRYRPHHGLMDHLPFAPVSVSTFGPPAKIRPLVKQLQERLTADISIIQSGTEYNWGVEVYVQGVSKRHGLETVAARLGVTQAEVMAIGDHFNDLEMLRWAGIGVAMGNALPEIKEAADHVTASVAEDGVAQAVERFVLGVASDH